MRQQGRRRLGKTVFIKSYGCQMNAYDSERMADILRPLGYARADRPEDADLVILNTCHIREKAAEKVYSDLGRIRIVKERRGAMLVAVAGCVAQAEGPEIAARAPVVDLVFGPQAYHRLPEMLARTARERGEILETDFAAEEKFDALTVDREADGPSAFVTIQEGCDRFCTFCVVPYTRGAEISRPAAAIEAEIRGLVARGVREVTLLGQNVNAWCGAAPRGQPGDADGRWGLGRLCRHLAKIGGLDRIRFTTSHPRDMDEELVEAFADVEELMPYLHLPVQAGSDRVLKAMNRGHTAADYLAIVERLRRARPDIAVSSDFIVGFPGETDEDFEATLSLVETVGFAASFSFKYSRRPGTPAAAMPKQVAEAVKAERLDRLQALLERQRQDFNASQVGVVLPVLFEKTGRHPGQIVGRSPYLQSVHAAAPESLIGEIAPVRIAGVTPHALSGVVEQELEAA
jgi:tRNA-2-methylthio-N6-dimethylallyladenosine synthase